MQTKVHAAAPGCILSPADKVRNEILNIQHRIQNIQMLRQEDKILQVSRYELTEPFPLSDEPEGRKKKTRIFSLSE
jgi:hypothetical protein